MPTSRLVLRVLDRLEACGVREEILGDLVEEMAGGRSSAWVGRQVMALCGQALFSQLRRRVVTPAGIALTLGVMAVTAVAVVPMGRLIQAWLVLYYVSGMASLFAHMATAELPTITGASDNSRP